jgi:hypothetical protein
MLPQLLKLLSVRTKSHVCAGTSNLQSEGSATSLPNPIFESDPQTVPAATHSHNRFLYYPCSRYIPLLYRSSERPFYNKRLNQNSLRISFLFPPLCTYQYNLFTIFSWTLCFQTLITPPFCYKVKYVSYLHKTTTKLLLKITLLFWKVPVILVILKLINIISTLKRETSKKVCHFSIFYNRLQIFTFKSIKFSILNKNLPTDNFLDMFSATDRCKLGLDTESPD